MNEKPIVITARVYRSRNPELYDYYVGLRGGFHGSMQAEVMRALSKGWGIDGETDGDANVERDPIIERLEALPTKAEVRNIVEAVVAGLSVVQATQAEDEDDGFIFDILDDLTLEE